MFTLEESAHLGAMLRFLGWTILLLALGVLAFFVLR
jgi:hypothetical protein